VLALRDAGPRTPILLLILGTAPPVRVTKHGRLSLQEAVSLYLDAVLAKAENHSFTPEHARSIIGDVICWVTWHEISTVIQAQCDAFHTTDLSLKACINRLASSITAAIDWHGISDA